MCFIPLRADAPIYHFPWATIGLIVANVVSFFLTGGGGSSNKAMWESWALELGRENISGLGLHPIQWISANFVHFGLGHLIGNMIFLWTFGLVVEGKLGWWRFLLVVLGVGIAGCFLIQLCMLIDSGGSFAAGASLIVFGLLAICLVWAPKNEVSVMGFFFPFYLRPVVFEVTFITVSSVYIGLELLRGLLFGFQVGNAGHLIGAAFGFAVGAIMLKRQWVDCENWDLFAVMEGTYGSTDEYESYRFRSSATAENLSNSSKRKRRKKPRTTGANQSRTSEQKRPKRKSKTLSDVSVTTTHYSNGKAKRTQSRVQDEPSS